jgi:hypothetical protein
MSYATGHNLFTNLRLLNIYIYCRLCIINVWKKKLCLIFENHSPETIHDQNN